MKSHLTLPPPPSTMTLTVTTIVCFIAPTVTVTVTLYVPTGVEAVVETVRVDVPDPPGGSVGLVGVRDAVGPLATMGETEAENVRVPLRRFRLDAVRVEEPDAPAIK